MTSRSILLVEDNPDDEALTLRALKKNNIPNEVIVAHDGAEAIELLFPGNDNSDGNRELPGVILLDLNLPKVGGLDVLRRIRADERTAIVPVVVLTSSSLDDDVLASYREGANGYVRKPVSFSQFAAAVGTLSLFWLQLNEAVPELANIGPGGDADESRA